MAISDERVYLDGEGKATRNASEGVSLLVGIGGQISDADAKKHGVKLREAKQDQVEPHIVVTPGVGHQGGVVKAEPAQQSETGVNTSGLNRTEDGTPATAEELSGDKSPAKNRIFSEDHPNA